MLEGMPLVQFADLACFFPFSILGEQIQMLWFLHFGCLRIDYVNLVTSHAINSICRFCMFMHNTEFLFVFLLYCGRTNSVAF